MKTFDELKIGDEVTQYIKDKYTKKVIEKISKVCNIFQNTIMFGNNGEPIVSTKHINIVLNSGKAIIVERNKSVDKHIYSDEQIITSTGELIDLNWK